jgi:catechol 2,3-dioxygenase-like lactoylglutathione lyase family enzyme
MLGNSSLVAIVMTADGARAKRFYEETLGLRFLFDDGFAQVFDANGVTLRVSMMEGYKPPSYSVVGWKVADIVATVRALAAAGVTMLRYPFLEQDELGIWTAPGGAAKVAFFSDPDGNVLSLTES